MHGLKYGRNQRGEHNVIMLQKLLYFVNNSAYYTLNYVQMLLQITTDCTTNNHTKLQTILCAHATHTNYEVTHKANTLI